MAIKTKKTPITPDSEPLTLAVAKEWLRISDDPSADDDLITQLIIQSRDLIEHHLNIAMIPSTVNIEATYRDVLSLQFQPITSVTEVKNRDDEDLDYTFNGFAVKLDNPSDIVATYLCGYDELPEGLLLGWKEILSSLYEHRGDNMDPTWNPSIVILTNPNLTAYNKQKWWV